MSTLLTILVAIVLFGIIILVHELGHFFAGKLVGIQPQEFSIGMGPVIFSRERKGIKYSLKALPIGGSCLFLGEDEENKASGAFNNAPVWRRMVVIASGPLMNFLLGIVLTISLYMLIGVPQILPVVGQFTETGIFSEVNPAREAGILPGDRIVGINGQYWGDLDSETIITNVHKALSEGQGAPADILIERDTERLTVTVTPLYNEQDGVYQIGIMFKDENVKIGFFKAIGYGFRVAVSAIGMMITLLAQLIFRGQGAGDVLGPVGIMSEIGNAVRMGWEYVLNLAIIISLNLGLINLIPFPALDGGRIALLAVEGIRRKPFDREKEGLFHLIGFAVLMLLMALITYRDIMKLFNK
jgi:regulator of sigma E protease